MTEQAKKKMQVVFASAECAPFVKTGGLGDVAGSLPAALTTAGAECIVMVPKYDTIADKYTSKMEHLCDFYVNLGWRNEYCGLEKLEYEGVTYLFIDNEHYFKRGYPYGFFDDGERFAFFAKAITEALQHLPEGFECDVLHCNDWQTALSPVFLREFYQGLPLYERVKTVFSVHNMAFQGQFSDTLLGDVLGLEHIPAASGQLRCDADSINYMLGALHYTDAITTVSPTYAAEIQTPEFGEGLDGVLRDRNYVLQGILNGIDTAKFDPATDTRIAANYSVDDMAGKAICKAKLQEELGLEMRDDRPLMVMVTRLTRQKGMDLVMYALDRILAGGIQVAVLGTGDRDYEDGLRWFESQYPGTMAARIEFDPALSQRMYAGADMFLMPSKFEPCGLSQIIAMRYGTLPVVRETGGLKDTVTPYNQFTGEGTGFSFTNFNGDEMGDTVFRAARLFWDDRSAWNTLVTQAMQQDFSWTRSAQTYLDLYHALHPEIPRENTTETIAEKAVETAKPSKDDAAQEKPKQTKAKAASKKTATTTRKKTATKTAAAKPASSKKTSAKAANAEPPANKTAVTEQPASKPDVAKPAADKSTTTKAGTTKATATKTSATKATTASTTTAKVETAKASTSKETSAKARTTKATATKTAEAKPAEPKASTATKSTTAKAAPAKVATRAAKPKATSAKAKAEEKPAASAANEPKTTSKASAPKAVPATKATTVSEVKKPATKRAAAAKTKKSSTRKSTSSSSTKTSASKKPVE